MADAAYGTILDGEIIPARELDKVVLVRCQQCKTLYAFDRKRDAAGVEYITQPSHCRVCYYGKVVKAGDDGLVHNVYDVPMKQAASGAI